VRVLIKYSKYIAFILREVEKSNKYQTNIVKISKTDIAVILLKIDE